MTVNYQLEPADLIAISEERRRFAPDSLSRLYYFGVLPALGVGLAVVTESLGAGVLFTLLYILCGWVFQCWIQRNYRRALCSNENLSFSARPWRATLTEEGVTFASDAAVALYRWPFIREVFRGSRFIHFVVTPLQHVHIPIRAFDNDEHIQKFVCTAQSYVKKPIG